MSRTYRNIEYAAYFKRPKTHNYRKGLCKSKEEIKEELGSRYLLGNNDSHKKIVSSWDDIPISARSEVLSKQGYMERILSNKMEWEWSDQYLRVDFNKCKNRYEISNFYYREPEKVYYFPFYLTYKNTQYPIIVKEHDWFVY